MPPLANGKPARRAFQLPFYQTSFQLRNFSLFFAKIDSKKGVETMTFQSETFSVKEKIAKAKKQQSVLKQIEKLEKEIAALEKKAEQKRRKLEELAAQL